ncbi:MAG: hypothetical protein M1114_06185, partial [Candidatus Dependentiae bacterium]|nr:hypothetical protein [Candidatus Dependentiae bacterium]
IVLINIPSLESYKNNDLTNKIATIIRSKYNISSKTQTATPLTLYRDDLTWYINRLWYLQILYLGTDKRSEIQELIANLKKIREILAGSKELKREQENIRSRQNQK